MKFAKFLKAAILKNICERLLLKLSSYDSVLVFKILLTFNPLIILALHVVTTLSQQIQRMEGFPVVKQFRESLKT